MWTKIPSSALRVTGPDRIDFVQGQMTNDLRGAPGPTVVPCVFLNVRGQIEYFARAYKRQNDVYLHLDEGQAEGLAARLKRYIIFDQVEVKDVSNELSTLHIWEEAQLTGWQVAGPNVQPFELAGTQVLAGRVRRTGSVGIDLHYLSQHEDKVLATLQGEETPLLALDAARIAAGIPDVLRDGFKGMLLQEIGLDIGGPLPVISYRKGCYVGQEIMARLEARGNTRYHLARVTGENLPSHAELKLSGKTVGQLGLVVFGHALARLRKEIEAGTSLEANSEIGEAEALAVVLS